MVVPSAAGCGSFIDTGASSFRQPRLNSFNGIPQGSEAAIDGALADAGGTGTDALGGGKLEDGPTNDGCAGAIRGVSHPSSEDEDEDEDEDAKTFAKGTHSAGPPAAGAQEKAAAASR